MTNHVFASAHSNQTSTDMGSQTRAHIKRLRESTRAARDQVNISLASIESSLLLLADSERFNYSDPPHSPPVWWDVYPALPKSIRLGEIEAADERGAIEKAAKKFEQAPAMLIVVRRA